MTNIAKNSKFNIYYNQKKSHGCYLFDDRTEKRYLDFFGMYSSLALHHNHDTFKKETYINDIIDNSQVKVTNCEFKTKAAVEFDKKFSKFCNVDDMFNNFHYCATGSLAVEAAIKTALHYKDYSDLCVVTLNNCFHGANSLGIFLTDKFFPANKKLSGYPDNYAIKTEANADLIKDIFEEKNPTCLLIEPIRCSAGDIHSDKEFFKKIRELCDLYDVPLIFDEIQTGFCASGKRWYFEHLGITPDIVIFGKKTQVSGIMVQERYAGIFDEENRTRLDVTFNGDVLDMVRCSHIIETIQRERLVENAAERGLDILRILKKYPEHLFNVRGIGLILAFDCKNQQIRDIIVEEMFNNNLLVNKTADKSVRLRPPLSITRKDVEQFDIILQKIFK